MAVGISSTVAHGWLNALCNASNYTAPTAFYVKLHTGDPGASGTSNAATETDRQQASFGSPSGGVIATDGDLVWTNVSATETYSHISFWDASTSGNFLGSDDLAASKSVTAGDTFTIATGDLTVTISTLAS